LPAGPVAAPGLTVAVVPGAFYVESPHTGADGRLVRDAAARAGCRVELIPLASFGALDANAAVIADWLRRRRGPVVLVSLSKGGAEVKRALARPDAAEVFRRVTWWVDLSGMSCGTPLAGWVLRRPLRRLLVRSLLWWRGHDFGVVRELDRDAGPLAEPCRL